MATKNYAVSNKARLLNITRQKEGLTFMQVLLRFIHERFLYRLSVSDYREHFFLKGGALLYAHEKFEARPTLLLDDMPEVNVAAYSLETVVAEKFQTMIDRAENNSRMKDFFDVYHILHGERICPSLLEEAVREVFANRGTEYQEHHPLFEHSFVDSNVRQAMWQTFLRKIKYKGTLGFDEVVSMITKVLKPIWDRMGENLV